MDPDILALLAQSQASPSSRNSLPLLAGTSFFPAEPAPGSSNPALPFSQQYLAYGPVEAEAMRRASAAAAEAILAKAEEWGRRGKQEAAGR